MKKLSEIFDCWYGVNLELVNCQINANGIPFVSRTSNNNGVVARVSIIPDVEPNPPHTLSLACGGSVLACFYQDEEYYSGRDLFILAPKEPMTKNEMLLYSYVISANKYKYNYGRQANKTFRDLVLPELPELSNINYKSINADFKFDKSPIQNKNLTLSTYEWKWFKLESIFECSRTPLSIKDQLYEGSIPLVSRTALNNGIDGYFSAAADKITQGNCITVGAEGIYAFYQPEQFCTGNKVYTLTNKHLNKYNALFITTILNKECYRYSYGRARGLEKLRGEKIKLPATPEGSPDWQFMEDYIKSLPYSGRLALS